MISATCCTAHPVCFFSTDDISFEGSSFVIASGQGSKPVQFNFESCIDAVIVSLMLDYYALRIPTGSEWV